MLGNNLRDEVMHSLFNTLSSICDVAVIQYKDVGKVHTAMQHILYYELYLETHLAVEQKGWKINAGK